MLVIHMVVCDDFYKEDKYSLLLGLYLIYTQK